jgi:hypothetical protein
LNFVSATRIARDSPQGAPHALLEPPGGEGIDPCGSSTDSLDALHQEKKWEARCASLRVHHLPDEIVKRIQIDAQRDSDAFMETRSP